MENREVGEHGLGGGGATVMEVVVLGCLGLVCWEKLSCPIFIWPTDLHKQDLKTGPKDQDQVDNRPWAFQFISSTPFGNTLLWDYPSLGLSQYPNFLI